MNLFSQRVKQGKFDGEYLTYFEDRVRERMLTAVANHFKSESATVLQAVGKTLYALYGYLEKPGYEATRVSNDPVIEHLFSCSDDGVLDFFEAVFHNEDLYFKKDENNILVSLLNDVLQQEHIGYELTEHHCPPPKPFDGNVGALLAAGSQPRKPGVPEGVVLPQFNPKSEELLHEQAVRPGLTVLGSALYETANQEFLQGLSHLRLAEYAQAMTYIGSAFESVFKSIIGEKEWSYEPDSDTLSKLVECCNREKLFPSYYVQVFLSVGTLRNKLSSSHGRANQMDAEPTREQVEHFVHVVASHILLLDSFRKVT